MILHGDYDLLQRQLQTLGSGLNDPQVCLMRNEPVEFALVDIVCLERLLRDSTQGFYSNLEHLVATHDDAYLVGTRSRKVFRRTDRVIQQFLVFSIGTQVRRDDSRLIRWLDDDGARTIAKQNASTAIIPVDQLGDDLGADNQGTLCFTGSNELVGG